MSVCSDRSSMSHWGSVCNSYWGGMNGSSNMNHGSDWGVVNEGSGGGQDLGMTTQHGRISIPFHNSVSEGESAVTISETMSICNDRGSVMYSHRDFDHGSDWGVMNDGCGGCQDLGVSTENSSVSLSLSDVMAAISESKVSDAMVPNCNRNGVFSNLMCDLSGRLNH